MQKLKFVPVVLIIAIILVWSQTLAVYGDDRDHYWSPATPAATITDLAQAGAPNLPPATPGQNRREQDEARKKAAERARREAGETRLASLLGGKTGMLFIRRADTTKIDTVYTLGGSETVSYKHVVREQNLDLPAEARALTSADMAKMIRSRAGVAIVVDSFTFKTYVFWDLMEIELIVTEFPPKERDNSGPAYSGLPRTLAPGDSPLLLIRRRDDAKGLERLFVQKSALMDVLNFKNHMTAKIFYGNKNLEDEGIQGIIKVYTEDSLGFPLDAQSVDLEAVPALIKGQSGLGIVIQRAGLETIYPRIAALDLAAIPFPPIDVNFGMPRDHKETADKFDILGVVGGMGGDKIVETLAANFAAEEIKSDPAAGLIRATRGSCKESELTVPAKAEELGGYCLRIRTVEGRATQVVLRQVLPKDASAAVLEALKKRYGRAQLSQEIRQLEGGGRRVVVGYGAPLAADRTALGRVEAMPLPTVLEAVVWYANGVTTVVLQLDSASTVHEARQSQTPAIKF